MSIPSVFLDEVFTRRSFAFAGQSILIYDYLLTFPLEVAYIWNSPWTSVKALFLFNRYANLIGQTSIVLEETGYINHNSQQFCRAFELYLAVFAVFSGESIRLLVVMRACAIMRFKRKITVLANACYIFCAVSILAVSLYWLGPIKFFEFEYLEETGICFAPIPVYAWKLWLIPLILDAIMFAFVSRSLFRISQWSLGQYPSRLVRLLARDAFLFYITALFNVLFFIACWTIYRLDPRNAMPLLFSFPLLSVVGQRLVLNLRGLRARPSSTRDISLEVRRQVAAMGGRCRGRPMDSEMGVEDVGRRVSHDSDTCRTDGSSPVIDHLEHAKSTRWSRVEAQDMDA